MSRLTYSREEILADHPYARPHMEAGYRLHGGFDTQGRYNLAAHAAPLARDPRLGAGLAGTAAAR